jgi:hypothetical protein
MRSLGAVFAAAAVALMVELLNFLGRWLIAAWIGGPVGTTHASRNDNVHITQ